jgi:CubicO group peptidase (beta-lactamase class C family)
MKKKHGLMPTISTLILIFVLLVSNHSYAQPAGGTKKIEQWIDSLAIARKLPGLAVVVTQAGKTIVKKGVGYADMEKKVSVDPEQTLFRIGSISKLFTATAALKLDEQGDVNIHGPIGNYLPDLPNHLHAITTLQLGGHLAGIRHYSRDEYINRDDFNTLQASLNKFIKDTLQFIPGSKYLYSSYGYNLLGAVAEQACGEDFRKCLRRTVLKPLKMKNTFPEDVNLPNQNRALSYGRDRDGAIQVAIETNLSDRWPSGGYWSTAGDLARFGNSLLGDKYLAASSKKILLTSQTTSDGKKTNVGFGWRVNEHADYGVYYHHGGDAIGGRAFLLVCPKKQVVIAMVSNLSFAGFGEKEALLLLQLL